jgi:hypothetical protein
MLYHVAYNEAGKYISVLTRPLVGERGEVENFDFLEVVGTNLDLCILHVRQRVKVLARGLDPKPPHDVSKIPVVRLEPKGLPSQWGN